MKHWMLMLMIAVFCVLMFTENNRVSAEALTVERYTELTIARLELVKASWEQTEKAPAAEALGELYQRFGTVPEEYVAYRGRRRREVDRYLLSNPELAGRIEQLSVEIKNLMEQAERR